MKAVAATLISRVSSFDASIRRAEARPVPIRLAHRTTRREFRADKQVGVTQLMGFVQYFRLKN